MDTVQMNDLYLPAKPSSPEINFRFEERRLSIMGEAYPENAALFWGEIIGAVRQFLAYDNTQRPIIVDVELSYFNSSSTKMLFSLFDALNDKAEDGTPVILNWYHDEDDDTIFEFGQELCEDFTALSFHDHATQS